MAARHRTAMAMAAHNRRLTVFLGSELRRAETRFCARRKGDSSFTSRSTRRASSSSSRACSPRGRSAPAGYNSSSKMVGLLFRAISSDSCRQGIAELSQYSCISEFEIDEKSRDLHRQEPDWIRARRSGNCGRWDFRNRRTWREQVAHAKATETPAGRLELLCA